MRAKKTMRKLAEWIMIGGFWAMMVGGGVVIIMLFYSLWEEMGAPLWLNIAVPLIVLWCVGTAYWIGTEDNDD